MGTCTPYFVQVEFLTTDSVVFSNYLFKIILIIVRVFVHIYRKIDKITSDLLGAQEGPNEMDFLVPVSSRIFVINSTTKTLSSLSSNN